MAASPPSSAPPVRRGGSPFDAAFRTGVARYLAGRDGRVSLAVYDRRTGRRFAHHPDQRFVTASVVKVAIMGALLRDAQLQGRSLTDTEAALMTAMIEVSDNEAATELWNLVGGADAVDAFDRLVGMPGTSIDPAGHWGLTVTTSPDLVALMKTFAYSNRVLGEFQRGYGLGLMEDVTASQAWGASGGVPGDVTVALKIGVLPLDQGWVVNSIGFVSGRGRSYVIAMLSDGQPSQAYGIETLDHLSTMVWGGLQPDPTSGAPGSG